jgi:hypothetical protein
MKEQWAAKRAASSSASPAGADSATAAGNPS